MGHRRARRALGAAAVTDDDLALDVPALVSSAARPRVPADLDAYLAATYVFEDTC
ncbi:MAG: hypothetical protein R3C32_04090 [Chloroflexota bacterium]